MCAYITPEALYDDDDCLEAVGKEPPFLFRAIWILSKRCRVQGATPPE